MGVWGHCTRLSARHEHLCLVSEVEICMKYKTNMQSIAWFRHFYEHVETEFLWCSSYFWKMNVILNFHQLIDISCNWFFSYNFFFYRSVSDIIIWTQTTFTNVSNSLPIVTSWECYSYKLMWYMWNTNFTSCHFFPWSFSLKLIKWYFKLRNGRLCNS